MKVIIDRFEGNYAVIEIAPGQFVNMPKDLLPAGSAEGTVLSIEIDKSESDKRHKRISDLMNDLWKD